MHGLVLPGRFGVYDDVILKLFNGRQIHGMVSSGVCSAVKGFTPSVRGSSVHSIEQELADDKQANCFWKNTK